VFIGNWHANNSSVHRCQELRHLRAWLVKPKSQDLQDLVHTTRLEWLQLTQTGVTSLNGLETLEDLRYLEIAYAPKLESIAVFSKGNIALRDLAISISKGEWLE
jgi:hypothetical protein